ncbi:MAG: peroxiredoxin [Candidatus Omnitrophica bacterium]|nr:peroxiredoxin [Candidatus Omnitrophota bacterium]MCM8793232.1 peroxiredoxin [Candidatus Omnitrophota bacterium]
MEEIKVLSVGEKVPDFELDVYLPEKKDFGKIKFSEIFKKGKWLILYFYPADYTFVCPTELADVGEKYAEIKKQGAELVSVSTDTHYVHYAWQQQEKLLSEIKYPMAADPTHIVSKTFGVYDGASGLSLRGTFIIDPDGRLVASEVNYFPVGRNSDELLRKLKAFKYVRENPAQVCPAKWEPGKKTLTPGKDLVGKVGERLKSGI